ncbi:MAG: hypothetical protein WCA08_04155 [Desulfoferrobacter sp.]
MASILLKACGMWFLLLVLAIANAAAREKIFVPRLSEQKAAPLGQPKYESSIDENTSVRMSKIQAHITI